MRRLSEAPLDLIAVNLNSAMGDGARSSVVSLPAGNGVPRPRRLSRNLSTSLNIKPLASPASNQDSPSRTALDLVPYIRPLWI